VVLLDAGHLGQTFALAATSLGLAPFCTAAIDDPRIEQHLGVDGIDEAVLFAVGVGARPEGKAWAPDHDGSWVPETTPPAWAARAVTQGDA
jgi:nitroreductase